MLVMENKRYFIVVAFGIHKVEWGDWLLSGFDTALGWLDFHDVKRFKRILGVSFENVQLFEHNEGMLETIECTKRLEHTIGNKYLIGEEMTFGIYELRLFELEKLEKDETP